MKGLSCSNLRECCYLLGTAERVTFRAVYKDVKVNFIYKFSILHILLNYFHVPTEFPKSTASLRLL